MQITARQIADLIDGVIDGDESVIVNGPSRIEDGQSGTITFLGNPKYTEYIYTTNASVVLVDKNFNSSKPVFPTLIKVDNVYASLAALMERFNSSISLSPGISKSASVSPDAIIGKNTFVDDFVIIKPKVRIGNFTKIYGQVFIGDNVKIGDNVTLYPGVKVYHNCELGNNIIVHANAVIGSDGFGFALDEDGKYKKIPQTGNVIIEDDVEIGSNTVIDRASIGSTIVKKGAKLDNLIQLAHNVTIGQNTAIAAQTGIAGSTEIGANCMIGGQVGMTGHIKVADGTLIQAQSGITSSIKGPNAKLFGTPAFEAQNYLKSYVYFKKLPEIVQQLRDLQTSFDINKESQKIK